jgi:hypothetical protein
MGISGRLCRADGAVDGQPEQEYSETYGGDAGEHQEVANQEYRDDEILNHAYGCVFRHSMEETQ